MNDEDTGEDEHMDNLQRDHEYMEMQELERRLDL